MTEYSLIHPLSRMQNSKLVFQELPKNIFVNKENQIYLNYVDQHDDFIVNKLNVRMVKFQLLFADNLTSVPNQILTVSPTNPHSIAKSGRTAILVRVSQLSRDHSNRAFVLHASLEQSDVSSISSPFLVINHLLCITRREFPHPVYNDNRGDKYLDIPVTLLDCAGSQVKDKTVPLRVSLHYDDGVLVQPAHRDKPTLIHLDNDFPVLQTGEGTTIVRVRIMQISRNHMNKAFVVRISADTSRAPMNSDVGYAECGPFEVRTKLVENEKSDDTISKNNKIKKKREIRLEKSELDNKSFPVLKSYPRSEDSYWSTEDTSDANNVVQRLDNHIAKLRRMMWKPSGKYTMLDVNGKTVESEQHCYHPPNPNAYISHFIQEYEKELRPYLKSITPDTTDSCPNSSGLDSREASSVRVLSSLAYGRKDIPRVIEQKMENIRYIVLSNFVVEAMNHESIGLPALSQNMELIGFFDAANYAFVPLRKFSNTVQQMAKVALNVDEFKEDGLASKIESESVSEFLAKTGCAWCNKRKHETILE